LFLLGNWLIKPENMMKKKMKILGMTAAILTFVSITPTTVVADDLLQDAGSWLQVVGEGSLKVVDPGLEKGRIWLEGQSRWDNNWNNWYQGMARAAMGYSLSDRATIWAGYTLSTYTKRRQELCSSTRCMARVPL